MTKMDMQKVAVSKSPVYGVKLIDLLMNWKKSHRDIDPNQWLSLKDTTSEELKNFVRRVLASPRTESGNIFLEWSNNLIHDDVVSKVRVTLDRLYLDILLKEHGATMVGCIEELSASELTFTRFVVEAFKDLIEIYAVDELGYTDIWLVFPELDGDNALKRIGKCQEFIRAHHLSNISYLTLSPESFTGGVDNPLLHITFRRDCGES